MDCDGDQVKAGEMEPSKVPDKSEEDSIPEDDELTRSHSEVGEENCESVAGEAAEVSPSTEPVESDDPPPPSMEIDESEGLTEKLDSDTIDIPTQVQNDPVSEEQILSETTSIDSNDLKDPTLKDLSTTNVTELAFIEPVPEILLNPTDKKKKSSSIKVIVRRLPPDMTEEQFMGQVTPVPVFSGFYYVTGTSRSSPIIHSRAYFSFVNVFDVYVFKEKFDNYVFLDSRGNEYAAVVEYAPYQRIPRQSVATRRDAKCNTIESDPVYIKFKAEYNQDFSDSTESKPEYSFQIKEDSKKNAFVSTPLIEFVNSRKNERNRRDERREERRKRDDKKRIKDEERRQRRIASREQIVIQSKEEETKPESTTNDPCKSTAVVSSEKKKSSSNRFESTYKSSYRSSAARDNEKPSRSYKSDPSAKASESARSTGYDSTHLNKTKHFKQSDRYSSEKRSNRETYQEKQKARKISKAIYFCSNTVHSGGKPKVKNEVKATTSDSHTEKSLAKTDEDVDVPKREKPETETKGDSQTATTNKSASKSIKNEEIKDADASNRKESKIQASTKNESAEATSEVVTDRLKTETSTSKSGPSTSVPSTSETKVPKTDSTDRFKDDPRKQRRIRNKDRPAMAIYRPGMGRFCKERKAGEAAPSTPSEDPPKSGAENQ